MNTPNQNRNNRGGFTNSPFYGTPPMAPLDSGFIPLDVSSPYGGHQQNYHQQHHRQNFHQRGNWSLGQQRSGGRGGQQNRTFHGGDRRAQYQNMHGAQQTGDFGHMTPRKNQGWKQQGNGRGGHQKNKKNIEDYVNSSMWEDPWKTLEKSKNESMSFDTSDFTNCSADATAGSSFSTSTTSFSDSWTGGMR